MRPSGRGAYAYARIRAAKSRLLTRTDEAMLFAATDAASTGRALAALGIDPHDAERAAFAKLLRTYARVIADVPHGAPLFRAMRGLHEIENVKAMWCGIVVGQAILPVRLLSPEPDVPDAISLRDLADRLAKTPYGAIAAHVLRAHPNDLAAAMQAFDRWAAQRVRNEAARLPRNEALTKKMIDAFVSKGRRTIPRIATSRAFAGDPFLLAPAVALLILAEAEFREVVAFAERRGDERLDGVVLRFVAER